MNYKILKNNLLIIFTKIVIIQFFIAFLINDVNNVSCFFYYNLF